MVNLAFFLLFPGFFLYHTLLGLGMIGAFLGGYFAIISIVFALPLAYFYLLRARRDKHHIQKIDIYFFIFLAYFTSLVAIHFMAAANSTIIRNHALSIVYLSNIFIIFKIADFRGKSFVIAAICSLALMSAIVFYYSVDGTFYLGSLGIAKDPESVATYQGFSRSYLITFIVVIATIKSMPIRMLMHCIAAAALFVNAARSEFAAMLLLIPLIELYFAKNKLAAILLFSLLLIFISANIKYILDALPGNRILELLDLSQSRSANIRHYLTRQAMQTIYKNPIFGDYASYVSGLYSHNILSAWVDIGFFGIAYLSIMLLWPAFQLLCGYLHNEKSEDLILAFSMSAITILLLLMSHYFTDMLIGATLGSYARYIYEKKDARRCSSDIGPSPQRHQNFYQTMPQPRRARLQRHAGGRR